MGEEIKTWHFKEVDFQKFSEKLKEETSLVKRWFAEKSFSYEGPMVGFELEAWLVDKNFNPSPVNDTLIKSVRDPAVVHELSRFNVELNSSPHGLRGQVFSQLRKELENLWQDCVNGAAKLSAEVIMIGILPTLKSGDLNLKNMSPSQRYRALNEQVLLQRGGKPLTLDIHGEDDLQMTHDNVMLEATATSLQIHVDLPPARAHRYYNAALILSAPMVALAANSPFLFGKRLWDETRVPVFEQAVSVNEFRDQEDYPVGRVTLGTGYVKESLWEMFQENLERYPPLLPILYDEPAERLRHFNLHNGTIWRWNRPLIRLGDDGSRHLRLEHRVAAAGPSILDVIANIAFFTGALRSYAHQRKSPESCISFSQARENFYQAAREGFDAKIRWLDNRKICIRDLLLEELIPAAKEGLKALEVDGEEIAHYLQRIIRERVRSGQNGATWQRNFLREHGGDFYALAKSYVHQQGEGGPVHEWSL
jgi:gamma-glutamyl:cysteine ligase YbdK (ATP-grasp superfamily)